METITSILLTDGFRNIPGISYLNFIELDGIASIANADRHIIDTNISLKDDYAWKRMEFTVRSAELDVQKQRTGAGDFYSCIVSGFYPKVQPEITYQFDLMRERQFVVVPKDDNYYKRLLGSKYIGCDFDFKEATKKLGDSSINGYDISFRVNLRKSPFFYLPDVEDAYLIPDTVTFTASSYYSTFWWYNSSDPTIEAVPADDYKRKFSVLAGKSLLQFAIFIGTAQGPSDIPDFQISDVDVDGTVTRTEPWPPKSSVLVLVK